MTDLDRRFLRGLLDEVDAALDRGDLEEARLAAQDVRDYVNHEGPRACVECDVNHAAPPVSCAACGRRFAEGIATAKPSPDVADVCTDCREGVDA